MSDTPPSIHIDIEKQGQALLFYMDTVPHFSHDASAFRPTKRACVRVR